jgi:hypothetical protein
MQVSNPSLCEFCKHVTTRSVINDNPTGCPAYKVIPFLFAAGLEYHTELKGDEESNVSFELNEERETDYQFLKSQGRLP